MLFGMRRPQCRNGHTASRSKLPWAHTSASLTGWRREFCVELLGNGRARIFVRAFEWSSLRATEVQRAVLFHHLDSRFRDLEGCVEAIRPDLVCSVDAARRTKPGKENLFASVEYGRAAWEHVQLGVGRWMKR